jgi:thiol:disulfide interchange protein DsbD
MKFLKLIVLIIICGGIQAVVAQEPILQARLLLPLQQIQMQSSYPILIEVSIIEGWHINSNRPLEEFLIPTEVHFSERSGISFGKIHYGRPDVRSFAFSETPMSVYEGVVYLKSSLTVTPEFTNDNLNIECILRFQACNDESCLAPDEEVFSLDIQISDIEGQPVNTALFKRFEQQNRLDQDSEFGQVLRESSFTYTLLFIFIGGLALNLTPCVYPLIPITISYFGGQGQGRRGQLVFRAVLYVLGMAITYSVLGVVAALTGGLLGAALQNPLVLIFVALVLVGLALSMFGLYEIRVPQSLALIGSKNRAGYLGTLFMGLTVGLIAAPCIGPFVLGLLTYVGEIGDPVLGFWMFFILAIGLGTPFLFLGIFSGTISYLPRSGGWMVWVRNLFGFVLIGMAIYFLEPLFPSSTVYFFTLALLAIVAGIYLAFLDKNKGGRVFGIIRIIIGSAAILLGISLILPDDGNTNQMAWETYTNQKLQEARENNQRVIIDFYADWCIPCKELDSFTFSNAEVIEQTRDYVKLKADLTQFQSDEVTTLRRKFDIRGVPTIVFLSSDGMEIEESRLIGFEDAESFLSRVQRTYEQ